MGKKARDRASSVSTFGKLSGLFRTSNPSQRRPKDRKATRRPRLESLEQRRLLAAQIESLSVNPVMDVITFDGDSSPDIIGSTTTRVRADQQIAVDPDRDYRVQFSAKDDGPAYHLGSFYSYDVDGHRIQSQHFRKFADANDTFLVQTLRPGDTTVVLEDATGWASSTANRLEHTLAWYGYADSTGHVYPDHTYTRNAVYYSPSGNLWTNITTDANGHSVLRLADPWNGPEVAANTAVRNTVFGITGTAYTGGMTDSIGEQWAEHEFTITPPVATTHIQFEMVANVQAPETRTLNLKDFTIEYADGFQPGDLVTLHTSIDPEDEAGDFTYQWQQTAGPSVTLSDPNGSDPTFIASDLLNSYDTEFTVRVTDGTTSYTPSASVHVEDPHPVTDITIDPVLDVVTVNGGQTEFVYSDTRTIFADNLIPIDPARDYELRFSARDEGEGRHYSGIVNYDIDGNKISTWNYQATSGSVDTHLLEALQPGDTQIVLENATGWATQDKSWVHFGLVWYGYADSTGKVYEDYTYTNNVFYKAGQRTWTNITEVSPGRWVLQLAEPWAREAIAAGTAVRNTQGGGYHYAGLVYTPINDQWQEYVGTFRSVNMRPGTAYVNPLFLSNRGSGTKGPFYVKDITFDYTDDLGYRPGDQVTLHSQIISTEAAGDFTYQWNQVVGPQVTLSDSEGPQATFVVPDLLDSYQTQFVLTLSDGWKNVSSTIETVSVTDPQPVTEVAIDPVLEVITFDGENELVTSRYGGTLADDYIAVSPERRYELKFSARAESEGRNYTGFRRYDIDYKLIRGQNHLAVPGSTDTRLVETLRPGDTQIVLKDATGWASQDKNWLQFGFAWFGYADSTGHVYDDYTYTQNVHFDIGKKLWTNITQESADRWVLDLAQPWSGVEIAADAAVRNAPYNGTNSYVGIAYKQLSDQWQSFSGVVPEVHMSPGLAYLLPNFLTNYGSGEKGPVYFKDVTVDYADDLGYRPGDQVTLSTQLGPTDATGDFDYQWQQTAGPNVTLSNPSDSQPTFVATDGLSSYDASFSLELSDGSASYSSSTSAHVEDPHPVTDVTVNPVLDVVTVNGGQTDFVYSDTRTIFADDLIPIDPARDYELRFSARDEGEGRHYSGIVNYDIDGNIISTWNYQATFGSADTRLLEALQPGDTQIVLENATGWATQDKSWVHFGLVWYGYADSTGKVYEDYTYTNNVFYKAGQRTWTNITEVSPGRWVLQLAEPWAREAIAAGTAVRNTQGGGYHYAGLVYTPINDQWQEYVGTFRSVNMRPGTAYVNPLFLSNRGSGTKGPFYVKDITFDYTDDLGYRPGDQVTLHTQITPAEATGDFDYQWQQTAGPNITLSDPSGSQPTFVATDGLTSYDASFSLDLSDGSARYTPSASIHVEDPHPVTDVTVDPVLSVPTVNGQTEHTFTGTHKVVFTDDLIPVDSNRSYEIKFTARAESERSQYSGFASYDIDGNLISTWNYLKASGAEDTRLVETLSPGDTQLVVENATGWATQDKSWGHFGLVWYGYADSTGKVYEDYTYTNNVFYKAGQRTWTDITEVSPGRWVLQLAQPWSREEITAGTAVRNTRASATYSYVGLVARQIDDQWQEYKGTMHSMHIRPGTAYVRPLFLVNYGSGEAGPFYVKDLTIDYADDLGYRPGDEVTLHSQIISTESTGDFTYQWNQVVGPQVTLSDSESPQATFVVPDLLDSYQTQFVLTLSDGWKNVSSTIETVSVTDPQPVTEVAIDPVLEVITFDGENELVTSRYGGTLADDYIAVSPERRYELKFSARAESEGRNYTGFRRYDIDYKLIRGQNHLAVPGSTDTRLVETLRPGDTQIVLKDATGWASQDKNWLQFGFAWFGYADSTGHVYDDYTYTQNVHFDIGKKLWTNITQESADRWVLDLAQPWSGVQIAADTAVRNAPYHNTNTYVGIAYKQLDDQWQSYSGVVHENYMSPGLAYLRPLFLTNYGSGEKGPIYFKDVTVDYADDLGYRPGDQVTLSTQLGPTDATGDFDYQWQQTTGLVTSLSDPNRPNPTFVVADWLQDYDATFTLSLSDGSADHHVSAVIPVQSDSASDQADGSVHRIRVSSPTSPTLTSDWFALGQAFTLAPSSPTSSTLQLIHNGDVLGSIGGTETVTVTIDRLDPGSDPNGSPDDQHQFTVDRSKITTFGIGTGKREEGQIDDKLQSLDELVRQAINNPSDTASRQAAASLTTELAVLDYLHEINQAANGILGDSTSVMGTLAIVSASNDLLQRNQGEYRFVPKQIQLDVQFPDQSSGDIAYHEISLIDPDQVDPQQVQRFTEADMALRRQIVESITHAKSYSYDRFRLQAEQNKVAVARLQKTDSGQIVDLQTEQTVSSLTSYLALNTNTETWIAARLNEGFTVSVPRSKVSIGTSSGALLASKLDADGTLRWISFTFEILETPQNAGMSRWIRFIRDTLENQLDPTLYANSVNSSALVDAENGRLVRTDADFKLPSIGIPIDISRNYSSTNTRDVGLGIGWTFRYGSELEINNTTGNFEWFTSNGSGGEFTKLKTTDGVTQYDGPGKITAQMTLVAGVPTYTIHSTDGNQLVFQRHDTSRTTARLTELSDRNQNHHQIHYQGDQISALVDVTDPAQPLTRLTFTATDGLIRQITDDTGRNWDYQYEIDSDGKARLVQVTGPEGFNSPAKVTRYAYGTQLGEKGLLASVTEFDGRSIAYQYDASSRFRSFDDGTGGKRYRRYDDFAGAVIDASNLGFTTRSFYDEHGRLTSQIGTDQSVLTNQWNTETARLDSVTQNGETVHYQYDSRGNRVRETQNGITRAYRYDPTFNQLIHVSEYGDTPETAAGRTVLQNQLDDQGNLIAQIDAAGNVTRFTYTSRGLLHSQTTPQGTESDTVGDYQTWFFYNEFGQLVRRSMAQAEGQSQTVRKTLVKDYPADANITWVSPTLDDLHVRYFDGSTATIDVPVWADQGTHQIDALVDSDLVQPRLAIVSSSPFDLEDRTHSSTVNVLSFGGLELKIPAGYRQPYHNADNVALGATATASSQLDSSHHAGNLVDGHYGDGSAFIAGSQNVQIVIELDQLETIDRLWLGQDRSYGYNDRHIRQFEIEVSTDGTNYTQVFDSQKQIHGAVSLAALPAPDTLKAFAAALSLPALPARATVEAAFAAVDAKFVRLTGPPSGNYVRIDEIEILRANNDDSATDAPTDPQPTVGIAKLESVSASPFVLDRRTVAPGQTDANGYQQPYVNPENVALDAVVTATSQYNDYHAPQNLVDGQYGNGSAFVAGGGNTSFVLDFGAVEHFDRLQFGHERVHGHNTYQLTRFTVETSIDGENYEPVFDSQDVFNATAKLGSLPARSTIRATFDPTHARFLRFWSPSQYRIDEIEVLDAAQQGVPTADQNEIQYVSSSPFDVNDRTYEVGLTNNWQGDQQPFDNPSNVALGATVTASNEAHYGVLYRPENLTDGHYGRGSSYWAAEADASLTLELDQTELIDRLLVGQNRTYGYTAHEVLDFTIEVSIDGIHYDQVFDSKEIVNGTVNTKAPVPRSTIQASFNPVQAKFVRFNGSRAVGHRFIIDEIEVLRSGTVESFQLDGPSFNTDHLASETFTYNDLHQLVSATDATGIETRYVYDDAGNVVSVIQPDPYPGTDESSGRLNSTATYDGRGQVLQQTDSLGNQTLFAHDAAGRILASSKVDPSVTPQSILTTLYQYDGDGNRISMMDPQGNQTRYEYDPVGRPIKTIHPDGTSVTVRYDIRGQVIAQTDAAGLQTTFQYDDDGRLTSTTEPDGGKTSYTYEAFGRLASQISPLGAVTTFTYDTVGRVIRRQTADQLVETFAYDADGNLTSIGQFDIAGLNPSHIPDRLTDLEPARQRISHTQYDAAGRAVRWFDPLENVRQIELDTAGRTVSQTGPLGATTQFTYDQAGRLYETIAPAAKPGADRLHTRAVLDANGQAIRGEVASQFDEAGDPIFQTVQERVYDFLGSVTELTNAIDQVTILPHDPLSHSTTVTDPSGRVITTHRDALGRPLTTQLATGEDSTPEIETQIQYDDAGRATQWIDPLGNVSSVVYDALGNVQQSLSPELIAGDPSSRLSTTLTYDVAGNVLTRTDPLGRTTTFTYDALGRRLTTTLPDPDDQGPLPAPSITNTYDGFGQLLSQTDHLGRKTTFTYDSLGRRIAQSSTDPDAQGPLVAATMQWEYDAAGKVTSIIDSTGRKTQFSYDASGRLLTKTLPDPDPSDARPAPTESYAYDLQGNLIESTNPVGETTSYEYDALGREIRRQLPAADPNDPASVRPSIARGYDDAGNVAWVTDQTGNTTHFEYNLTGKLTAIIYPAASNSDPAPRATYTYDDAGNLLTFTDVSGLQTRYTYDALGRPTSQTVGDPDGDGPLTEFTNSWVYDAAGNIERQENSLGHVTQYVYDRLDREITRILPDPDLSVSNDTPYFHKSYDAAGNLASVTDALGRTTALEYDNLGRLIRQIDPDIAGVRPITQYQYDQAGNLVSTTDPLNRVTHYRYDNWGRVVETSFPDTNASSLLISQQYDDASRVISETDSAGRFTQFIYDGRGQLISTLYPDLDPTDATPPVSTRTEYNLAGQVTASIDTLGRKTQYQYDAQGQLIAEILPAADGSSNNGPTSRSVYDNAGNLIQSIDPLQRVTSFQYDAWGREILRTLPDPDGDGPLPAPTTATTYDSAGNVASTTDHLGRQTTTDYDRLNRPVATTFPDANPSDNLPAPVYTTTYDAAGNVVTETDALGRVTRYIYDNLGRQLTTILPDPDPNDNRPAPTTSQQYDLVGNVIARTDQEGATATWTYDALDRTISETYADPDGAGPAVAPQTTYTYDNAGNLATEAQLVAVGSSLVTQYAYDAWNRQVSVTAPEGDTTLYDYDTEGNLLSLTDASGNVTSYTYDALNRQTVSTNALGKARTYAYDDAGRLTQRTDRNGRVTQYTHDNLDGIIAEKWFDPDGSLVRSLTSVFDAGGRQTATQDGTVHDLYSYDNADQLTTHARTGTGLTPDSTFAYTYNVAGELTATDQSVDGQSIRTAYHYDGAGRIAEIAQSGSSITDKRVVYQRSDYGQVTQLDRYAGTGSTSPAVTTDVARDAIGRRTGITHRQGAVNLADYAYTYDAASRTTSIDSLADGLTNIGLDQNGRLTSADHSAISDESFQYDATGNRISPNHVTTTNNRLLSDEKYDYQYDAEGNRTARIDRLSGERTEYTYDHRNRLTHVHRFDAAGTLLEGVQYTYDSANQRISRAVDSDGDGAADQVERFVVDGTTVTAVLDQTGAVTNHFFHGAAIDEVLADESANGQVLWTLADAQKTIRDLATDVAGSTKVVNHRIYDSFGNLQSQTNASIDHLFGFTGRDHDEATGLDYYRDRWYDPAVGRFLSEDPIGFDGGDTNLSVYVGNAPYDYTDPTGNSWLSKAWRKIKREVRRVIHQVRDVIDEALDDIGDFFEEAWDDTRDFIKDHPIISGALAIATGTWFISAAGGLAAAGAKLATGITNVIGSFTPTISSTSVGASINVGSFASASVGAGVNGLTAFAGANVSILGVPVWGVGSSLSALGSFGSTIGGSITNNLLGGPSLFGSGGSIDVGSFAKATVNSTLTVLANESGLTTVHDAFHATRETAQDIYRALAPPPPPVMMPVVSYAQGTQAGGGLQPVEGEAGLVSMYDTGSDWGPFYGADSGYGIHLVGHNDQPTNTRFAASMVDDLVNEGLASYVREPWYLGGRQHAMLTDIVGDNIVTFHLSEHVTSYNLGGVPQRSSHYEIDNYVTQPLNIGSGEFDSNRIGALIAQRRNGGALFEQTKDYLQGRSNEGVVNAVGNVLESSLHMVPLGGALDYTLQGKAGEAALSLAGDAAMFIGGPLAKIAGNSKKLLAAGKATQLSHRLKVSSLAIEAGVGGIRAGQGIYAVSTGKDGAAGYFGEAALRLFGAGVQFKSVAKPVGTNSAASRTVFRGERASRTPESVFEQGLQPKGSNGNLLRHVTSNQPDTGFTSTSIRPGIAKGFAGKNGYTYVIRTKNGVDVNVTLGSKSPFPEQFEVAIPGGVPNTEVMGAFQMSKGKIVGDFLRNPNFRKQ